MNEERGRKMKEALKSKDAFLEFLKQEAMSDEHKIIQERVENGPHPTIELLYDYVLNWTDDTEDEKIMDHIGFCSICSNEVLNIIKIEQELDEGMLEWANKQPLIQRIKYLVSSLSLPVYGFSADSLVTRTKSSEEEKSQYAIGESMVFCVPVTSDGYLVILHYDDEKVSMVFPAGQADDNFINGGSEKKISGRITGPTGKQFFKVFWTSQRLIEPKKIDFQDNDGVARSIDKFLDALDDSSEGEWVEMEYGFEVIEDL
jgi:hypothetical protein